MKNVLLSPKGRLSPPDFVKAMSVLGLFLGLMNLMPLVHPLAGNVVIFFGILAVIIPTGILLVKRAHDCGKAGAYSFLGWCVFIVIFLFISSLAGGLTGYDEAEAFREAMKSVQGAQDPYKMLAVMNEYGAPYYAKVSVPNALASIASFSLGAVIINFIFGRDPKANAYGPAD